MGEFTEKLIAASVTEHVKSYFRKSKSGKSSEVKAHTRHGERKVYQSNYVPDPATTAFLHAQEKERHASGFYTRAAVDARAKADSAAAPRLKSARLQRAESTSMGPMSASEIIAEAQAREEALKTLVEKTEYRGGPPSREEIDGLRDYTKYSYGPWNAYLRTGEKPQTESLLEGLDALQSLIKRARLTEDVKAYRGAYDRDVLGDVKVGSVITDKAFTSFSTDRAHSESFVSTAPAGVRIGLEKERKRGGVLIETTLPKGSRVIDRDAAQLKYDNLAGLNNEKEFIADAGSALRVVSMTEKDGDLHLIVEFVQQKEGS